MNWENLKRRFPFTSVEFEQYVKDNQLDTSDRFLSEEAIWNFLKSKGYERKPYFIPDLGNYEEKIRVIEHPILKGLPLHVHLEDIVHDCKSVEEFCHKYYKPERFTGRGEDYVKVVLKSNRDDLRKLGYACISEHCNITGKFIAYVEQK